MEYQNHPENNYLKKSEITFSSKTSFFQKKAILISIIIGSLILIGVGSLWAIDKFVLKTTALQLLPENTQWYVIVNTDSQSSQVQTLKYLAQKFPLYQKIEEKINKFWESQIKEYLEKQGLDFLLPFPREIIIAQISPFKKPSLFNLENFSLVLITKKKNLQIKKLISSLKEKKDLKIEKEQYKGKTIYTIKAIEKTSKSKTPNFSFRPSLPKTEITPSLSISLIEDYLVAATQINELKEIIDVYNDQSLLKFYKFRKKRSLTDNKSYQQIAKNFPKEYLLLSYGANFNLNKEKNKISYNLFTKQLASALQLLNLQMSGLTQSPFLNTPVIGEMVSGMVVKAEKDGLKINSFVLNLSKDKIKWPSFSPSQSLAYLVPEKVNGRWVDFYREGRDLEKAVLFTKAVWKQAVERMTKQLKEQETKETKETNQQMIKFYQQFFKDFPKIIDQFLGLNLEKDLLPYTKENYAYFIAPAFNGSKPEAGVIIEINDPEKVKENLKKLRLNPNVFSEIFSSMFMPSFSTLPKEQSLEIEKELPLPFFSSQLPTIEFQETSFKDTKIYFPINCSFNLPFLSDLICFSYAIKENKLILSSSLEGVKDIIRSLDNKSITKLVQNKYYQKQAKNLPDNIQDISYQYTYGIWGIMRWFVSSIMRSVFSSLTAISSTGISSPGTENIAQVSIFASQFDKIFDIVGDLVGPYLKTVRCSFAYTITEDHLQKTYQNILIEELSSQEKKKVEKALEKLELLSQQMLTGMLEEIIPPGSMTPEETLYIEKGWDWDIEHHCHHLMDAQECENIDWPQKYGCRVAEKHTCYTCFAQLNKDASICDRIENQFYRDNCYWTVVVELNKANKKDKINFCHKISNLEKRNACLDLTQ